MKIRKLHIDEYKMFKDFDIDFVDEHDEALPIVVLAGVNGSGKTSLLECLQPRRVHGGFTASLDKNDISITLEKLNGGGHASSVSPDISKLYPEGIDPIYFPASVNQLGNIEIKIVEEYIKTAEEIDSFKQALKKLQSKIDKILEGLNIGFRLSRVDYNNKKVFLENVDNNIEFEISTLSTGEKTLISKVLLLYFGGYEDKIILIDEPELSLHPSWQNKVLRIYENFALENNCQIIIATHSPHIIGSAKPEYIRVLKKVEDKIEVAKYTQSYGLEFNKILTDIMGADTRVSEVSDSLSEIKSMIVQEKFDSKEFQKIWMELEKLIGADNIDLRLLKLEIASRKKNAQNK